MRKALALTIAAALVLAVAQGCTKEVGPAARPRPTGSLSTPAPPPKADASRWFQLPRESGVGAALEDGTRWLLLGGKRALAKADGSLSFATSDPEGLSQIVFSGGGAARFHGIAGDSLLSFDGPLGASHPLFKDARLSRARLQSFAGRLLVLPEGDEPFLIGLDGRDEAPLASALPFEPSSVAFGSATVGFAMTEAFGLLKTGDGARSWSRAAPLLEGQLATRQGIPVEYVPSTGKTTGLAGFALTTLENKTAAIIDRSGKDPLVLAASGGLPLEDGDILVAVASADAASSVGVTLLRLASATGEVRLAKPLSSYPRRPSAPAVNEPRCNITRAAREKLLVECDGRQLYELDEALELSEARLFEGKVRLSEMGGAVSEGDCLGGARSGTACVRNADGSFSQINFERSPGSSATLLLAKPDGTLVVVDFEAQGFSVRQLEKSGAATNVAKLGSRVRAAKIHGDLDRDGALTLVVEGSPATPGALPAVEVSTVVEGRVKTDSFPGALTGRNVGGRVVLRSATEIIVREETRGSWQRIPRKAPALGEVRVSRAGFVAGEDVRLGWPLSGVPTADAARAPRSSKRELVCSTDRNMRSLPRLDTTPTSPIPLEWTRALGGKVAVTREGARYRVRFHTRKPVANVEELYVPARVLLPYTVAGAAVRGSDIGVLLNTMNGSFAIRRVGGVASIEKITTPLAAAVEITIGSDGSLAWDRGRPGARQIVLWPKSGAPRDALSTDRNNFRFLPFDKGLDVLALGPSISSVAHFALGELGGATTIEPGRFKSDAALGLMRLLSAPACRAAAASEAGLFDVSTALTGVVLDGERLPTSSFELGFDRTAQGSCMALAFALTERNRWQLGVDMSSGAAVVTKSEYLRLPASCALQPIERTSP